MSDDLVERVALVICEDAGMEQQCRIACAICKVDARAAIAVCMEEAASYCEMKAKHCWGDGRDCCDAALQQTAAAIRSLVKEDKV